MCRGRVAAGLQDGDKQKAGVGTGMQEEQISLAQEYLRKKNHSGRRKLGQEGHTDRQFLRPFGINVGPGSAEG